MLQEGLYRGRIVKWLDFQYPFELVRECAENVHRISQKDDPNGCKTSRATGIEKRAEQHTHTGSEEQEGKLQQLRNE